MLIHRGKIIIYLILIGWVPAPKGGSVCGQRGSSIMLALLRADIYIYLCNMFNQPNISVKILFNVALKFKCQIN